LTSCHVVPSFSHATATTEIYPLSLHDALPIYRYLEDDEERDEEEEQEPQIGHEDDEAAGERRREPRPDRLAGPGRSFAVGCGVEDRKSTRLNSSHVKISYAVFCLKKKKKHADD